jgi:hypothetical protein
MMVYNTQNYWIFGLVHHPGILKLDNTMFQKLDPLLSSGTGRACSAEPLRKT